MITRIDRYHGVRPGIMVYGDGRITETEAVVLSAFWQKYQEDVTVGVPITVYPQGAGDLLVGSDVRAPFNLSRQEPGYIARLFGAKDAVILERGYMDASDAEDYLDGIVEILSRSNPSLETRDTSRRG